MMTHIANVYHVCDISNVCDISKNFIQSQITNLVSDLASKAH